MITGVYYMQLIKATEANTFSATRNLTMNNNNLKLYKNVTTPVLLEVRRLDRKLIKIGTDKKYYFNIITKDGERSLLRKQFEVEDIEKGRFRVVIEPEDIDVILLDTYAYSVTFVNEFNEEHALYLSSDGSAVGYVEISNKNLPTLRPPFTQFKFTPIRSTAEQDKRFISSRLPVYKASHSLTIKMTGWTGKVVIQSTKEFDPDHDLSWSTLSEYDFTNNSVDQIIVLTTTFKFYRVYFVERPTNTGGVVEIQYI